MRRTTLWSREKRSAGTAAAARLTSPAGRLIVLSLAVLWTVPTFGVFVSSFRPEADVKGTGWWTWFLDPNLTLDNYRRVLSSSPGEDNMLFFVANSFRITIPSVFFSIVIAAFASYALTWMRFRGRDWIFVGIVALLMVPLQMALIPMLQVFTGGAHIGSVRIIPDLDLTGTMPGIWIAHTAFGLPICIYILRSFMTTLPGDIVEAARIDGANHLAIFWRIILPLSAPAIASLGIFQFMWIWNDYLVALIFVGRENAPVTAQLATVTGTRGQSWHLLTAAGMVSMILPIAVFLGLQRYFVRGLLAGSVKG